MEPDEDQVAAKQFKKNRKSSYEAPKSCEMIEDGANKKKIKMYQEFDKFFSAKGATGTKGFAVDVMTNNEFGNALKQLGIGTGWKITECANKVLGNKMFAMLKNQISAAAKKQPTKGYIVVFENPNISGSADSVDSINSASNNQPKVETKPKKEFKITPKKKVEPKIESAITNPLPTANIPSLAEASNLSTTKKTNIIDTNNIKNNNIEPDEDQIAAKQFKKNRKSSYEAPKSCEMIQDGDTKKKIKMYQEFDKFFSAKGATGSKGFAVDTMTNNEFGNALKKLGIGPGWQITECAGKVLGNKMFAMLKNQISAAAKKQPTKGYIAVFENLNGSSSINSSKPKISPKASPKATPKATPKKMTFEEKKVDSNSTNPSKKTDKPSARSPRRSGSSSRPPLEMIQDGENTKVIRLYHNIDKFVKSAADKGPKGYKIVEYNKMFGNDLKELGVEIGWKLTKLGKKDVSKAFYQMTKTNLGVEFRNCQNKGYEVTFSAL